MSISMGKIKIVFYLILLLTFLSFFILPLKSVYFTQGGVIIGYECHCLGIGSHISDRAIACHGIPYGCASQGYAINNLMRNFILVTILRFLPLAVIVGFILYKKLAVPKKIIYSLSIITALTIIACFFPPLLFNYLSNKESASKQDIQSSPVDDIKPKLLPQNIKRNIICYPDEYNNQIYKPIHGDNNSASSYYYFSHGNSVYLHKPITTCEGDCPGAGEGDFLIKNADHGTFKCIDLNFAKDKNHVYYWGEIVEKADPESFEPLDWPKSKDKNYYFNETKIEREIERMH